uniref:Kinase n=1 Tax=Caenorhabditis japonica TaxID=281687 RepID=A0A8R1DKI0_CAEJA
MVLNIKRASSLDGSSFNVQDVLKPFVHQVGGHTPFTSLPNGHLLKPCHERELFFYQQMPSSLKSIAPLCCSTIQGTSLSSLMDCCTNCTEHQLENIVIPESIEGSSILNKRKLSRNFIILSDLTHRMKSPRILDLKLGTRQHGDQATAAKAACMTAKCQATTSATLGIRLCGMKYDNNSISKYEGRAMREQELCSAIRGFFNVHREVLDEARRKLKRIRETLCEADGVRLFGSSLLFVIEGDFESNQQPINDLVRIKVVDFANATFSGFLADNLYPGIDDGSLLGLDTLNRFLDVLGE